MRKGWEYKKLGEVCCPKSKIQRATKCFGGSDEILYIDISSIDNSVQEVNSITSFTMSNAPSRAQQKVEYGDIIVSTVRPNLKNVAFIKQHDSNLVVSSGFCVLRTTDDIERNYLFRYITSDIFTQHLMKLTTGANYPAVRDLDVRDSTIPLPPKSTQIEIVSELDKINELIRLKKEQLKDFDNLAQSLFYEMFGDPVENEKGWDVKKLKDISREIGDGLHGTPEYSEVDTGCYFINGNNLENGTIVIKENTKMVSEKTKAKHYIEMDDFTILVSINGTLGKVAFYNGENVILGKSACYIKLEAYNDKKYIFELLKSDYFKRYAESECTGTTIRNVSLKSMRNFRCPLPPLPLQRLFAQRIEQIEREKSEGQKASQDLETLLASRMQYWFE